MGLAGGGSRIRGSRTAKAAWGFPLSSVRRVGHAHSRDAGRARSGVWYPG